MSDVHTVCGNASVTTAAATSSTPVLPSGRGFDGFKSTASSRGCAGYTVGCSQESLSNEYSRSELAMHVQLMSFLLLCVCVGVMSDEQNKGCSLQTVLEEPSGNNCQHNPTSRSIYQLFWCFYSTSHGLHQQSVQVALNTDEMTAS